MSYGLVATDVAAARSLAGRLRGAAALAAGDARRAADSGDRIFGAATSAMRRVSTEATQWRTTTDEVVRALAVAVVLAADDTERADGG